jgi:pimeloyl-ACP methyl ester carboxylesterase
MSVGGLDAWRRGGREFDHRGHRIFYRDEGAGDAALLLIHGFPTASWDWARLWPQLVQKFPRAIAPDMIGFGFSAKPAGYEYSIFDQADLHEKLLAQLGVKRVHLLAHDYGDTVAQELLARHAEQHENISLPPPAGGDTERGGRGNAPTHPSPAGGGGSKLRIESCALLNGGLFPEVHRARLIQKLLLTPLGPLLARLTSRRGFGKSFAAIFGAGTQPSAQELDQFWALIREHGGHRQFHRLIRYMPERKANRGRWVGVLQQTKVPLRFINGPDDPISGAHMVARYRELVPQPDTVSLPGIGHYPQVEDPAGVLRAFLEFHARLPR